MKSVALQAQGRPEVRAEAIGSEHVAGYVAAGVLFPVGTYVRSGLTGAAGIAERAATFRLDQINIFHTDPFRESNWAVYGGGGLSLRHDAKADRTSAHIVALIGVEGPRRSGRATAFELGLGGGVRASLILRKAQPNGR